MFMHMGFIVALLNGITFTKRETKLELGC